MPASLIAPLLVEAGWGAFAVSAATLAIRLATTYAIASLLNKDQGTGSVPTQNPGAITLPPATTNKLPVIYGTSYVQPAIVDAILSEDQQTMWYVLAFGEATDSGSVNFEEIWWDGKLMLFDPANPNEISGLWTRPQKNSTEGGTIELGAGGKIAMYFYRNGVDAGTEHRCFSLPDENGQVFDSLQTTIYSATEILNDTRIPEQLRWTTNDMMKDCVFAICRINYDSNNGVRGLAGTVNAKIVNTLASPGAVIKDYLMNERYGCGVTIDHINQDSLDALDILSADQLYITDTDGNNVANSFTYQINGIVNTDQNCLSNLNQLTDACDSWLQWDERTARWGVIANQSFFQAHGVTDTTTMRIVNSSQIIGGINLVPTDLKSSANKISITFPNTDINSPADVRYYYLEPQFLSPNEPENNIDVNMPFVNNSIQATYLGYRKLWMSREDMVINFTMDYSGIGIDAGDIIGIQHEWYGWAAGEYNGLAAPGKPFRVTQIKEVKDASGFLSVQITAMSYNDSIYTTMNPHYYTPDEFGLLTATSFISKPDAPIVPATGVNTTASFYTIQGNVPASGNVTAMEFWYSETTSTFLANNYVLYSTQYYNGGSLYPHLLDDGVTVYYEQSRANGLPQGIYWWRTRAVGPNTTSEYSEASDSFSWSGGAAGGGGISGLQLLDNSISGSKVVQPASSQQSGTSQSKGFFDTLGPLGMIGLGGAAAYYAYKYLGGDNYGKDDNINGGGNDNGIFMINPTNTIQTTDGTPISNPQVGDSYVMVADATPPQPLPAQTYADNGFSDYSGVSSGDSSFSDWA